MAKIADGFGWGDRVDRPLAQANGLGNETYTSAEFLALEREHLFAKTWSCIGFAHDVAKPRDVRPVDMLGIPLLMLRDNGGVLKVFHNVCSHRGLKLVTEPGCIKRNLVCPYHAWVYETGGDLIATPNIGGQGIHECDGFDKAKHGLVSVRTAVWMNLVFVNLSGTAVPFEEHIAPVNARLAGLDLDELRFCGSPDSSWELEVAANWKLAVENHNDAYHLPTVHPRLNSYSAFSDHFDVLGEDFYAGQGSLKYRPRRPEGSPALPRFSSLPEHWRERAEYIALFPNAVFGMHADHAWTLVLEPLAPDRTLERSSIYYIGDAALSDDYALLREAIRDEWRSIFLEDQWVVEGMQEGRSSPAFAGGVFSPALDKPTHMLHRWVATHLGAALNER